MNVDKILEATDLIGKLRRSVRDCDDVRKAREFHHFDLYGEVAGKCLEPVRAILLAYHQEAIDKLKAELVEIGVEVVEADLVAPVRQPSSARVGPVNLYQNNNLANLQ
jgi:hypothetical protein